MLDLVFARFGGKGGGNARKQSGDVGHGERGRGKVCTFHECMLADNHKICIWNGGRGKTREVADAEAKVG
jgi:hypothetical protein